MNTYPAILKSKSESDTRIMLAYDKHQSTCISNDRFDFYCGFNFDTSDAWQNITREYLANTKVKIESEGHEILVRGVASNADLLCALINGTAFIFDRDIEDANKEIIIPLPPTQLPEVNSGTPMPEVKEPKKVSMNDIQVNVKNNTDSVVQVTKSDDESNIFICVSDLPKEPETKEWPQVGDEVLTASKQKASVVAIDSNQVWIKYKDTSIGCGYATVAIATLSKPLTPEEELAKELEKMVYDGMDNSYDLNHSCYYLVSGLMKRYDIKKKPE